MAIVCSRCGANLGLPSDPEAMVVVCSYCNATTPLHAEHVRLRQAQQQAIDERGARAAMLDEERRSKRWDRMIWSLGIGGILVLILGSVALSLWSAQSDPRPSVGRRPPTPADDPQSLALVTPVVQDLATQGCRHVVEAPNGMHGDINHKVRMSAGGNCLRLLAGTAQAGVHLSATMRTPTGSEHDAKSGPAELLELEHCPTETGEHLVTLATTPTSTFAYALVDCAPQREKYRDDPRRNGLEAVRASMSRFKDAGCDEVLLAPQTVAGERQLTAELNGARCTAMVTAGDADNPLAIEMRTPFGEAVPSPEAAVEVRLVYCAETKGPHVVDVKPTTDGYYTFAGMSCPASSELGSSSPSYIPPGSTRALRGPQPDPHRTRARLATASGITGLRVALGFIGSSRLASRHVLRLSDERDSA